MQSQSRRSLLSLSARYKVVPVIENRQMFEAALASDATETILLRHCNIFELTTFLDQARQRDIFIYVNVDHIEGIHPDLAGLSYLADHFHVRGIISSNPRNLTLGKNIGLETIQRIFAVDSTGLETSLESVDTRYVDLLDISPALVVPAIAPLLLSSLPLSFIASGLVTTPAQVKAVLQTGALRVTVTHTELWQRADHRI